MATVNLMTVDLFETNMNPDKSTSSFGTIRKRLATRDFTPSVASSGAGDPVGKIGRPGRYISKQRSLARQPSRPERALAVKGPRLWNRKAQENHDAITNASGAGLAGQRR